VQATVSTPGTGLIDRIHTVIPDAWFGGGYHDDMPFDGWGSPGCGFGGGGDHDQPFGLAIRETDDPVAVQTAFSGITLGCGSDGREAQGFSIWEIVTGHGGELDYAGGGFGGASTDTLPDYAGMCLDTGWGAPCFRDAALPIIVHFTDICSHISPPGEDAGSCPEYSGITFADGTPFPHWTDMVAEMNRRGAKYVGCNASGSTCAGPTVAGGYTPCYFMKRT